VDRLASGSQPTAGAALNETHQRFPSLRKQILLGLGSALLNPKNALFYLALMTALLGPDVTLLQQATCGVWMVMVVLAWDLALVSLMGLSAVTEAQPCAGD
jgi:threonine/homoserine/homoserine lactone efflux protein